MSKIVTKRQTKASICYILCVIIFKDKPIGSKLYRRALFLCIDAGNRVFVHYARSIDVTTVLRLIAQ